MTSKTWSRIQTPEGDVETRTSGGGWEVHLKPRDSDTYRMAVSGNFEGSATLPLPGPDEITQVGGLAVDSRNHQVTLDGKPLDVGPAQFSVLHTMIAHPKRLYTLSELGVSRATLTQLRKKLGPSYFINRRGRGWSLV